MNSIDKKKEGGFSEICSNVNIVFIGVVVERFSSFSIRSFKFFYYIILFWFIFVKCFDY